MTGLTLTTCTLTRPSKPGAVRYRAFASCHASAILQVLTGTDSAFTPIKEKRKERCQPTPRVNQHLAFAHLEWDPDRLPSSVSGQQLVLL